MPRSYRHSSAAGPRPRLLYSGILLFAALAILTFLSVGAEWRRRTGQSRARALFELVQEETPTRPTETPGLAAWLHRELRQYQTQIDDPERARLYGEAVEPHEDSTLPSFLSPIRDALALRAQAAELNPPLPGTVSATPADPGQPVLVPAERLGAPPASGPPLQFRVQRYLELAGQWFVVTRRKALDAGPQSDESAPSNRFLALAARRLLASSQALRSNLARRPLPALAGERPAKVVRLYALAEDGTLVSLPFLAVAGDGADQRRAVFDEGREFRKLPELPSFVPNEFAFRFDFSAPRGQSFYSGPYLDLGGQGVVATLSLPVRDPATGLLAVLSADLTLGIDWRRFAARIEPPLTAAVVALAQPARGSWRPWGELARGLGAAGGQGGPELRGAVTALAAAEAKAGRAVTPFYLYHGAAPGRGTVAALQVAAPTWLLILFPETHSTFALLPAVLLALLAVLLLAGFELSRRRTESAQRKAEAEFAEKQNLLNTMQVPLMVVDPNTDQVVFSNQAAASLGIQRGTSVQQFIAGEPRAREHYQRMQVAGQEPRRAYGLPVQVNDESGREESRYAIVRSVAVTAPIESLGADERHRLGILFLVEPEADLALYTEDLAGAIRADERRKLAALLSHGLDTLARVLGHRLAREGPGSPETDSFTSWLAGYLERRVLAIAWLLEHWEATPPLPPDTTIESAQARATAESYRALFRQVRADPHLRSRLHWDNGTLAGEPLRVLSGAAQEAAGLPGDEVMRLVVDWPDDHWFACPLRGGFGFFLGEVLINAVKHGRPGHPPVLAMTLDRVRRELLFVVENDLRTAGPQVHEDRTSAYGGRQILTQLARLFEWRNLRFERLPATFRVSWSVSTSERGDPGRAD